MMARMPGTPVLTRGCAVPACGAGEGFAAFGWAGAEPGLRSAVSVTAEDLPDLPAAVEVAAYRIVTEALANVARHSTSPSAIVRLDLSDDALRLEVTDTGRGDAWRPGVGMSSMRERASELGGTLEAGPGPDGGRVAALLPL